MADPLTKPKRIQRKRSKGSKMPEGAVFVGRPTRWGNPYVVGEVHPETFEERTREEAVDLFRRSVKFWWPKEYAEDARRELAGKDLACWCPLVDDQGRPVPCHADILIALANEPQS